MMIYLQQNNLITSSEPTVWDGDLFKLTNIADTSLSSEPTVWDGDPRWPQLLASPTSGSEPTVWDGDICHLP